MVTYDDPREITWCQWGVLDLRNWTWFSLPWMKADWLLFPLAQYDSYGFSASPSPKCNNNNTDEANWCQLGKQRKYLHQMWNCQRRKPNKYIKMLEKASEMKLAHSLMTGPLNQNMSDHYGDLTILAEWCSVFLRETAIMSILSVARTTLTYWQRMLLHHLTLVLYPVRIPPQHNHRKNVKSPRKN